MSHTVIGLFRNRKDAENAVLVLENKGFDSTSIDVSKSSNDFGQNSLTTGDNYSKTNDLELASSKSEDRIKTFFTNLFGGDKKEEASTYTNAARKSDAIVTVHANNDLQALDASKILDETGAIDAYEEEAYFSDLGETNISLSEWNDKGVDKGIREQLEVGKRGIEEHGLRSKSRIIERLVEGNMRLRSAHITAKD